jgi:ligand-binding sensor domain-containing protein
MTKTRTTLVLFLLTALAAPAFTQEAKTGGPKLPYVYTSWKHFTVKDGLPNDHIFAVRVDGPRVWVGTEDGLALIDKPSGRVVRTWQEKDGLPWKVVTAIDVDKRTGDVWLGLFGGGLARLSGGRFDHWHQLNSGLVNDVVYGVTIEGDKVYLAVWGSGVLEYDIKTGRWKEFLDPDGEMEIDLYRDDGINHVIVTGANEVDGVVWVSSYFGASRYDGRHWRGYAEQEGGLPSDFNNNIRARSQAEALYCSDKGLGIITNAPEEEAAWVAYTRDPATGRGRAKVTLGGQVVEEVDMPLGVPHSFMIAADVDGNDIWVGTGKGLGWGIGEGYYPGTRERPMYAYGERVPGSSVAPRAPVAASPEGQAASRPDPGKAPAKAGR